MEIEYVRVSPKELRENYLVAMLEVLRCLDENQAKLNKHFISEKITEDSIDDDCEYVLAKYSSKIIGFISYSSEYDGDFGIIDQLFVNIEYRGIGIGNNLIRIAENAIRKRHKYVHLLVLGNNKACELYKRLLYKELDIQFVSDTAKSSALRKGDIKFEIVKRPTKVSKYLYSLVSDIAEYYVVSFRDGVYILGLEERYLKSKDKNDLIRQLASIRKAIKGNIWLTLPADLNPIGDRGFADLGFDIYAYIMRKRL